MKRRNTRESIIDESKAVWPLAELTGLLAMRPRGAWGVMVTPGARRRDLVLEHDRERDHRVHGRPGAPGPVDLSGMTERSFTLGSAASA